MWRPMKRAANLTSPPSHASQPADSEVYFLFFYFSFFPAASNHSQVTGPLNFHNKRAPFATLRWSGTWMPSTFPPPYFPKLVFSQVALIHKKRTRVRPPRPSALCLETGVAEETGQPTRVVLDSCFFLDQTLASRLHQEPNAFPPPHTAPLGSSELEEGGLHLPYLGRYSRSVRFDGLGEGDDTRWSAPSCNLLRSDKAGDRRSTSPYQRGETQKRQQPRGQHPSSLGSPAARAVR